MICCDEGVDGDDFEGWRCVDDDVVVFFVDWFEVVFEVEVIVDFIK